MDIHIRDSNFFSDQYPVRPNPYINWIWDRNLRDNDITVFTDCHLNEAKSNGSRMKIAVIFEPPVINSDAYSFVASNYDIFDYIFTYDESMLNLSKKFIYYSYGTSWIAEKDRQIYPKNRMTSIIASGKNWSVGHKLRHEAIKKFGSYIDVMGGGYTPVPSKLDGLTKYRYSLVIENSKFNSYFTEKLIDCFMTGVVPIYWGCPRIGDFFDFNGLITFDVVDDLDRVFGSISDADYQSRIFAIKSNFDKAHQYLYPEKWIAEFLNNIEGDKNV